MTSYQIVAPHFVAGIVVEEDYITRAAPILKWTLNKYFPDVLRCFEAQRWQVIPMPTNPHVRWLEYDGVDYELIYRHGHLAAIIRHDSESDREIPWSELPQPVKLVVC